MDRDPNGIKRPSLQRLNIPSASAESNDWRQPRPPSSISMPESSEQKSGIDRDILLTGVGCVLILLAGLMIAGVFALRVIRDRPSSAPPSAPIAAVAPTPTDTPVPTRTPVPTHVSIYTPLPTWTPMGTKPQVSDYRGHDKEYHDDIIQIGDFMTQSITDVNALLQDPQPGNQNWQYKVLTQTDVWQAFFSDGKSIIPPDQYQEFHQNLLKALSHLNSGANDINYALDYDEPKRLDDAKTEIATGSKMLNDALASLRSSA